MNIWLRTPTIALALLATAGSTACGGEASNPAVGPDSGSNGDGDRGSQPDASSQTDAGNDAGADSGVGAPGDVPLGHWETLAEMPELPRYYVGVAAARGWVFVVGGFSDGPEELAVHAYDIASDSWQRLADLPAPYPMPNVASVEDRLFVLGGLEVNQSLEYDFDNDTWIERAPVPASSAPGGAAVAVQGDRIFLAGGVLPGFSSNLLNTGVRQDGVYAYDVSADLWLTLPSLPVAVGYAMAVVIDGELWVMGGSDTEARTDRVDALDLGSRTWSEKPVLPISLSSAASGVLQGRIYVTGGIASSSGVISNATFAFDAQGQRWVSAAPMPTPRFAMAAAVVDDKLYVPTGIVGEAPMSFVPVGTLELFDPQ